VYKIWKCINFHQDLRNSEDLIGGIFKLGTDVSELKRKIYWRMEKLSKFIANGDHINKKIKEQPRVITYLYIPADILVGILSLIHPDVTELLG